MKRRLIGYPTGWTLAVMDDDTAARSAATALVEAGIAEDQVVMLTGPDAGAALDRLGTSTGLAGRLRRSVQFMTMDQLPDLHIYETAIERGRPVIGVHVDGAPDRQRAVDLLRTRGAHFINRFGAWATEEIAPWRGEPLRVPELMRR